MTSGQFASFPVDQIYVIREERQRRELSGLEELAASLQNIGQIHPLVIERDGRLRVGERRWTAAKDILHWTHINVQFVDELDEHELQLLELEENLKRINLPWHDECNSITRYHDLRLSEDPAWTLAATADMLGMSEQKVGEHVSVARALAGGNKRVAEAPKFSTAKNIVARVKEREAQSAIKSALSAVSTEVTDVKVPLVYTDFHNWALTYDGPPFNMIHCDFPYGVDADKHAQGQAKEQGGYADSFDVYEKLIHTLQKGSTLGTFIAESAHMIFWFSMDYYSFTRAALEDAGWTVLAHPLIWYKNDNTGILPDPMRGPRRLYETAFFCSRGDRKLTGRGAAGNVCAWPGRDKSIHMSEKPVGMLKHFMGMVVDGNSRVLDPTCGSGNALKAATQLGAERVLGIERDKEFYERAVAAYYGGADE